MTPEELQAAIDAVEPAREKVLADFNEFKARVAEALERKDSEAAAALDRQCDVLKREMAEYSATLAVLREIAQNMQRTSRVDPTFLYAEAVESRIAASRMGSEAPADWRAEMAALVDAKSFYWSSTMVSIVQVSAAALPSETIVDPELFPVKAGWWWFGRDNPHILFRSTTGAKQPHRIAAIAWLMNDDQTVWCGAYTADWPDYAREMHRSRAGLATVWNCWLALGRTITDISAHMERVEQIPSDAGELFQLLRFLVGGLLFLKQRVLVSAPATIGRGARKRVQKITNETGLQIVHLRRAETLRGHITERTSHAEFGCQWWVRGHWRQQPYKDGIRPKWIDPFIKGDPDKPMKAPNEKVFAVVR